MQRVAAYLLERYEDLEWPEARRAEGDRIIRVVEQWIRRKGGVSTGADTGTYDAVDGSDARYRIDRASDGDRLWSLFELTEVTPQGRCFVTSVSVTVGSRSVFVFAAMEVGNLGPAVNTVDVDPKCPRVVRDLLGLPGVWRHGASRLYELSRVDGFEAGEGLALGIQNPDRTIPFVVVSRVGGEPALPMLDEHLAFDLAGLANVYSVDKDASWALSDRLRTPFSTFSGAVRIYWPKFSKDDDRFRHHLWTASRLQGLGEDGLHRIRRQLRRIIMHASAVSVVRPIEIDEIQGAAARSELAELKKKASALDELKKKATSLEEFRDIADLYANENDALRRDLRARDEELERLRIELRKAEANNQALVYQLQRARHDRGQFGDADVEPDSPDEEDGDLPPMPGEIRFYKKHYSNPSRDVMLRVADCGHNAWERSAKADKARKGIAHLEGRDGWSAMQHCSVCTGGGMWRVQW